MKGTGKRIPGPFGKPMYVLGWTIMPPNMQKQYPPNSIILILSDNSGAVVFGATSPELAVMEQLPQLPVIAGTTIRGRDMMATLVEAPIGYMTGGDDVPELEEE